VIGNAPIYELTSSGTLTFRSMNMTLNTTAVSGPLFDNNAGGALTVNIVGCSFTGVGTSVDQNKALLQFEAGNTGASAANVTVNVQNSYFYNNRTYGMFATAAGDAVLDVTLNQSGFGVPLNSGAPVNNPGFPGGAITNAPPFSVGIAGGSNSKIDFDITNNTFWGARGLDGAIYVVTVSGAASAPTAHLNGFITDNKIGKPGTVGSGCANGCAGIGILPGTAGTVNTTIANNEIRQVNSGGIDVFNSAGAATANVIAHITTNTLAEPDTTGSPLFQRAILLSPGNSAIANEPMCAEVTGNIISGAWTASNNIRVNNGNNNATMVLPGLSPATGATVAQVQSFVSGNNGAVTVIATLGAGGINGGPACPVTP
jgi:hypothetical protein